MQVVHCICSIFYILINFSKRYHNLFTYLCHKKSYAVRHSVRAGSGPRRRPHLPPPPPLMTYAHTILLGEKLSGSGVKNIRRWKNYPAAEYSSGGRGWAKNKQKYLAVPKLVAQCQKNPIPYLNTLRDHSLSLYITKNTTLTHCRN